jgi:hypothetical protein
MNKPSIVVTVLLKDGDKQRFTDDISETAQQAYDLAMMAETVETVLCVSVNWFCSPSAQS